VWNVEVDGTVLVSKYEFIAANQQRYPVTVMCRVLDAGRSGL
jgi:hypothetical protein